MQAGDKRNEIIAYEVNQMSPGFLQRSSEGNRLSCRDSLEDGGI